MLVKMIGEGIIGIKISKSAGVGKFEVPLIHLNLYLLQLCLLQPGFCIKHDFAYVIYHGLYIHVVLFFFCMTSM